MYMLRIVVLSVPGAMCEKSCAADKVRQSLL